MSRLLLTALLAAIIVALVALSARLLARSAAVARDRLPPAPLGETPMQRLSFVLLVAVIAYAAIWGGG